MIKQDDKQNIKKGKKKSIQPELHRLFRGNGKRLLIPLYALVKPVPTNHLP